MKQASLDTDPAREIGRSGRYESHVNEVCAAYRLKRDAILAALDHEFAGVPGVTWLRPEGGLYVWLTLPEEIETGFSSRLFQLATKTHRVMYVPGELCYPAGTAAVRKNQMRLSYGVQDAAGITEGILRLAAAIRELQT